MLNLSARPIKQHTERVQQYVKTGRLLTWLRATEVVIVCWLLSSCSSLPPPLPESLWANHVTDTPSALTTGDTHCCWQLQQQLQVTHNKDSHNYMAIVAYQPRSVAIVVLSPLGQRLASITHTPENITREYAPYIAPEWSLDLLLSSVYLAYWPEPVWQLTPPWRFQTLTPKHRELYWQQDLAATVKGVTMPSLTLGHTTVVDFPTEGHTFTMTTRHAISLSTDTPL